jgi:hypothetical protein
MGNLPLNVKEFLSPDYTGRRLYRGGFYAIRYNGDKRVSEGLAKVFSAGSFFLTNGIIAVL